MKTSFVFGKRNRRSMFTELWRRGSWRNSVMVVQKVGSQLVHNRPTSKWHRGHNLHLGSPTDRSGVLPHSNRWVSVVWKNSQPATNYFFLTIISGRWNPRICGKLDIPRFFFYSNWLLTNFATSSFTLVLTGVLKSVTGTRMSGIRNNSAASVAISLPKVLPGMPEWPCVTRQLF